MSRQLQHLVAQRGRVRQRLEADPVLGEPGDRQRARDRSERDDQLVVGELDALTVDPLHRERPRCGSAPVTLPITSSVRRSCERSGTTTWRGSSVAPAAPGSSGV